MHHCRMVDIAQEMQYRCDVFVIFVIFVCLFCLFVSRSNARQEGALTSFVRFAASSDWSATRSTLVGLIEVALIFRRSIFLN